LKNKTLNRGKLIEILGGNTPYFVLEGEGGSSLVFIERGGRLIGAFPKKESKNALWAHPQLEGILQTDEWNAGGDRLWLSPEQDFFYKNPQKFEDWFCPKALDPGNYKFIRFSTTAVTFQNIFDFSNMRTGDTYKDVCVTRTMNYLSNPYVSEPGLAKTLKKISYVGMRSIDEVLIKGNYGHLRINPWVITQVNPGPLENPGIVIVPIKGADVQPVHYFDRIPDERLTVCRDHVSFKIDGKAAYKLGIKPEDLDPKGEANIGYLMDIDETNQESLLLVRRSNSVPRSQAQCFDVPKRDPNGPKGSIQCYNSGPGLSLGEIELQLNPLKRKDQGYYQKAVSDLLIFQGPRKDIAEVAKIVLHASFIQ